MSDRRTLGDLNVSTLHTRRAGVATVVVATIAALLASGTPIADAAQRTSGTQSQPVAKAQVDAPIPALNWHKCDDFFFDEPIQCARATVPLDYDAPNGPTTSIYLSRAEASEPTEKIGTLFVNPGGPGGPSSDLVGLFAMQLGPEVMKKFDIVGIDPRGVGRSTPLRCKVTDPPKIGRNYTPVPLTLKQARPALRLSRYISRICAQTAAPIIDHMSTADTARDMDLVRQALGEEQLSYYGISYGSYLGATYAAMFPDRVRAVVIDGVLDPVAWSTGRNGSGTTLPFSTRLRSGAGAWDALVSAFNECDRVGKARCKYAGKIADRWRAVMHKLKKGPVSLGGQERLTYADMTAGTLGLLYDQSAYRFLFQLISVVHKAMLHPDRIRDATDSAEATKAAKAARSIVSRLRQAARNAPGPYGTDLGSTFGRSLTPAFGPRYDAGFEGVACTDSINPTNPRRWLKAGKIADRVGPWYGRVWTWMSNSCATWKGSKDDSYFGPWRTTTANPLMIIGNFHDPATPISGARVANSLFEGSRMVSLKTWGHGALGQSACVTHRMTAYFVSGSLPPNGLVCQPDRQLFPPRR